MPDCSRREHPLLQRDLPLRPSSEVLTKEFWNCSICARLGKSEIPEASLRWGATRKERNGFQRPPSQTPMQALQALLTLIGQLSMDRGRGPQWVEARAMASLDAGAV
ncbi:hypothetical protein EG329_006453 [Mollisiaceae sp. DMI_Dod_QoI]|nr:hypothetical protein EG329_006453 [Helotiales sp. DMI_Dod_QoI]